MDLEPLLRFWRAQDDLFDRVEPAWWGAVVSDPRYPRIQEPNCARVETRQPVELREVEDLLLPAMARSGSGRAHAVVFHAEDQTGLVVEASSRGERLVWDLVMANPGADGDGDEHVRELDGLDAGFWTAHRASLRWFDVVEDEVLDQLQAIERDVLVPAGRRWFVADGPEGIGALAALLVLEGVGYVDHVVTFPPARRRGLATALTRRAVAEATAAGADRSYLLAEPGGPAASMYEAIGFEPVTQIVSWISNPGREP
ncbi:MAG: GNAT family N-acetyltransferase [Actinomycetota bacterium]